MNTKQYSLRPFDKSDWQSFMGCESKTPEIADMDADNGTLILDDCTVQFILLGDAVEDTVDMTTFSANYETKEEARLIAEAILESRDCKALIQTLLEPL